MYLYDTFAVFTLYYEKTMELEKRIHTETVTFFVLNLEAQPAPYLESNESIIRCFSVLIGGSARDMARRITLSVIRTTLSG
jgi:hypothetical protein